ncbi:hypothetical protein GCM10027599_20550 [Yimella radicis]
MPGTRTTTRPSTSVAESVERRREERTISTSGVGSMPVNLRPSTDTARIVHHLAQNRHHEPGAVENRNRLG